MLDHAQLKLWKTLIGTVSMYVAAHKEAGYVPSQYGNCLCFDVQHIASFSDFPLGKLGNEASMRARAPTAL